MIRRRVGIFGATDETLRLVPLLWANAGIEISGIWDPDPEQAVARAHAIDPELALKLEPLINDDFETFSNDTDLDAVIDAGVPPGFQSRLPNVADRGMQVVSPLTARLLWGFGVPARDRKGELLNALSEVADSVDLTVQSEELFRRMLEIAVGATAAEGGSLMLLDPEARVLHIRVAIGVERELWPKICVRLGEGIAGRAAADARSIAIRGKADQKAFQIVRERLDVESALCVPLVHDGRVQGVLNLHHSTRPDAFSTQDLEFAEQLAVLDARIIARAREHEALRDQAARYRAIRDLRRILAGPAPLPDRLRSLCNFVSERVGRGIVHIYLYDPDEDELALSATSLEGGRFGGEYRVVPGQGIDGRVAQSGQPAFLRGEAGGLAFASLPLRAGNRTLGVLSVQVGGSSPGGRAAEETLLEIAAAAADAVAQAERESRMSSRATRVSAINETGIRMLSTDDLSEVVRTATSSVAMILEADHAVLRLQDEESQRYVIRSYFGPADGRQQELLFRLDKQICVSVIKRRIPLLVRDLASDATLSEFSGGIRSLLSAPLKREGRIVGALSVYDKVAADRFYAGRFNDEDLQIFSRFVTYAERAVATCAFKADVREHRNFDEETGLPNASYIGQRMDEEVLRSSDRPGAVAVAVCRIENLEELESAVNPAHAHRVVLCTADALRSHLRNFDVLGRTGDGEFAVLLPEPGSKPEDRVSSMARAVVDAISKDASLNDPVRVVLSFGYAVHPEDGHDRESLFTRAAEPRIRMV